MTQVYINGYSIGEINKDVGGASINIPLSVQEAQVKSALVHKSIGIYASATAEQGEHVAGGSAAYRVPSLIQVQSAVQSAPGKAPTYQTPQGFTEYVNINQEIITRYEIDEADMSRLDVTNLQGEAVSQAIMARFAENAVNATRAHFDAVFLNYAIQSADNSISVDINSATTRDLAISNVYFPIADAASDIEATVDVSKIGVDRERIMVIGQNKLKSRLIVAQGGMTSDSFTAPMAKNELPYEKVSGLNFHTHVFLNKSILQGSSFDNTQSWDFTNKLAVILHTEAIAFPYAMKKSVIVPSLETGNNVYIMRWNYGIKKIRNNVITVVNAKNAAQDTYDTEILGLKTFLSTASNAQVSANGADLGVALLANIKAYTGAKTSIDVSNVTVTRTVPTTAGTVTQPTQFNADIYVPSLNSKVTPTEPSVSPFYKNA